MGKEKKDWEKEPGTTRLKTINPNTRDILAR